MRWQFSIRQSLLLLFLALTLLPILGLSLFGYHRLKTDDVNNFTEQSRHLGESLVAQINTFLLIPQTSMQHLQTLLLNPELSTEHTRRLLDSIVRSSTLFDSIYLLDAQGKIENIGLPADKTYLRQDFQGLDMSHLPFFRESRQSTSPIWSEPFLSVISGKMSLAIALAIDERTLVGNFRIDSLAKFTEPAYTGVRFTVAIVDRDGAILIHPDPAISGSRLKLKCADEIRTGSNGPCHYFAEHEAFVGFTIPIPRLGWTALISEPQSDVYRQVIAARGFLFLGGCAIFLLAIVFSMLLAKKVSATVGKILHQFKRLQSGDYEISFTHAHIQELQELGLQFKNMAAAIQKREAQIVESREHYRLLVETMEDGLIIVDKAGKITFANPSMARMADCQMDQFLGSAVSDYLDQINQKVFIEQFAKRMRGEAAIYQMVVTTKSGKNIPVRISPQPYYQNGQFAGSFGIVTDISEIVATQTQLLQYRDHLEELVAQRTRELAVARDRAEAANRTKSIFLANMSHELRTPLNAILGFSQMLFKKPELPDTVREEIDIIRRSGEHLLALIDSVLDLAKIEAGRVPLKFEPVDLQALIRDVVDITRHRAESKNLQLLYDLPSALPRYIRADAAKIKQVLVNLIINGIKFTDQGGVALRLITLPHPEPGWIRLLCEIEDTGTGIAEADLSRIFDPFEQARQQAESMGTGLGLTIAQHLVQMMEGTIAVESTPDQGSLFRVEFPVEVITLEGLDHLQKPSGQIIGLAPGTPEQRILIVEDQPDNRLLLNRMLTQAGFSVREAEDGEKAVEVFHAWKPHFIWMDRRMPTMDGVEAVRQIRNLEGGNDTIIVALTASVFSDQRSEVLRAGFDDFLRKPFRDEELFNLMAKHLGISYLHVKNSAGENIKPTAQLLLTPLLLQQLPEDLRAELRQAATAGDAGRLGNLFEQAPLIHSELRPPLRHLVNEYRFDRLVQLIDASAGGTPNQDAE